MATYQDIKGLKVKFLSADPSNLLEGDVWYNSASDTLKVAGLTAAAWASGGAYPTDITTAGTLGTTTAALGCGGNPAYKTNVNEYDGSSWTAVTAMSQGRRGMGQAGTQTAGLIFGGAFRGIPAGAPNSTTATEEYDGTNWTTGGVLPVGKDVLGSGGIQTAAFGAGGYISPSDPGSQVDTCEEYDGSNWTAGGALSSVREQVAVGVMGTLTAGLITGGHTGGTAISATEEYNGTSWTAVTASPVTLSNAGGTGPQTAAKTFGGRTTTGSAPTTQTASTDYDGTNWTASAALGTARWNTSGAGATNASALCIGGDDNTGAPTISQDTEEFSSAVVEAKTITTS